MFRRHLQRVRNLGALRRLVGLKSALHWTLVRAGKKIGIDEPETWRARPRQVQHSLTVRLRGSSDMRVFDMVFRDEEYSCLRDLKNVSLVLDLGANVGFSSAYFLNCFPGSRVVAVEPDTRNIEICRINLAPYGTRVRLLHGAAWGERTRLRLSKGAFRDGREWTTQVCKPADGSVGEIEAWDVGALIDIAGGEQVDLLKIDIERAELAVFGGTPQGWLSKTRNICIELHGQDCRERFFGALANFNYDLESSGELTICRNLRVKARQSAASA